MSIQHEVVLGSRVRISSLTHLTGGSLVEDDVQIGAGVATVDDNAMEWPHPTMQCGPVLRQGLPNRKRGDDPRRRGNRPKYSYRGRLGRYPGDPRECGCLWQSGLRSTRPVADFIIVLTGSDVDKVKPRGNRNAHRKGQMPIFVDLFA